MKVTLVKVTLVLLAAGVSRATPLPLYSLLEGSSDVEEILNSTSPQTTVVPVDLQTRVPRLEADAVVDFLEENLLLVLVSGTLVLLTVLVLCGALLMSRRRKVNAYYPSSFPTKMYVDHRDKSGGANPFHEVPVKLAPEPEVLDSHHQLQADIMRAAKSLRTASKPEGSESSCRPEDQEKMMKVHEVTPPESEQEPPTPSGPGLRPTSLHLHSDSATLQLMAGEKTAF